MLKPRLTLHSAWYDCGWRYESWMCAGGGVLAFGGSPAEAYRGWKEWNL